MLPSSAGGAYAAASIVLTTSSALAFAGLRAGLPAWTGGIAVLAAAALAALLAPAAARTSPSRLDFASLAIVALAAAWVAILFGSGVLPPGDAIGVPQFARTMADGTLLTQAYPPGSPAHAYPPGVPILFAPLAAWLRPVQMLLVFKAATLAAVVLIPAAWAWMQRALFDPPVPGWLLTAATYAAFFVMERTLGFATPFAGKNAVLAGLLLFPAVAVTIVALSRGSRLFLLAAVPAYGLALAHYTMLHLMAAFLGAYTLSGLALRRVSLAEASRVVAIGVLAVGLFVLLNREALHDPRSAGLVWRPIDGTAELVRMLIAQRPALVIFHDAAFGLPPSPWRGLQLLACGALAGEIAWRLRDPGLGHGAATWLFALLASLAFAYGVVPAGITLDFVRWYAWPPQAGLFATTLLALFLVWRRTEGRRRRAAQAAAALAAVPLAQLALTDGHVERAAFRAKAVPRADLHAVAEALPDDGACFLIGESAVNPAAQVTVQRFPAWAYAEALSSCRYLTGSWVHPGVPGGRALGGFPAPDALAALPDSAPLIFTGSPEAFARFDAQLRAAGLALAWRAEPSPVAGASVWRAPAPWRPDANRRRLRRPIGRTRTRSS